MIRLPDLPASNPQQAAPSAASVAAPARALQDISQGLATTGQALQSEALRIQQIENARLESETRQQWNSALAQLNQELATETDPAQIPARTEQLLTELAQTLDDDRLPPAVRQRLALQYAEFNTRSTISAGERAASLAITRGKKAFQNEIDDAIRNHDRPALHAALDTATDAFGLLPEDRQKIERQYDATEQLDLLDLDIAADPAAFLELSQDEISRGYPMLTRQQIQAAQSRARSLQQHIRRTEFDHLTGMLDDGTLTAETIDENPHLTNQDKARLKRAISRDATESFDIELHNNSWNTINELREAYRNPELTDAQYQDLYNNTRAQILADIPATERGPFNQELSYRSPANRQGGRGDPAQNLPSNAANRSEARAFITRAFNDGLLGETDSWQAFNARQDLHVALDQYLQQNPGVAFDTVRQWLQTQLGITATSSTPLINVPGLAPAPPPVTDEDISNALNTADASLLPSID